MMQRSIGIVGGMGPHATSHLVHMIYTSCNAEKEWELPRLLVDFNTSIPSRGKFFAGLGPCPSEALAKSALTLEGAGAEVIAIGCITAHHFLDAVREAVGVELLDAVALTVDHLIKRGFRRPFLLGSEATCAGSLFEHPELEFMTPTASTQVQVRRIIEDVKRFRVGPDTRSIFQGILDTQGEYCCDCTVLACSELSLLCNVRDQECLIDPMRLLAQALRVSAYRVPGEE